MNEHYYLSTACLHGLHQHCRRTCKFCGERCLCLCHQGGVEVLTGIPTQKEQS